VAIGPKLTLKVEERDGSGIYEHAFGSKSRVDALTVH
jgi:hypothetical protein